MLKTNTEQVDVVKANTAAFMALSKIAFSSVERLASVNLEAARAALEGIAASNAWSQAKDVKDLKNHWSPSTGLGTQRIADYLCEVQEIAAQAQEETTKLMTVYFTTVSAAATAGTAWAAGFDLFKNFAQQMTSLSEANIKAASEASSQMTALANPPARKAA